MSEFDDSALLHGRYYDPVKAREYYLRTRELKGRRKGRTQDVTSPRSGSSSPTTPSRPKGSTAQPTTWKSHREQVAALEARLERLKDVLAKLVEEAKARSGIETKTKSDKSDKSESSSKGGGSKKGEKRTAAEKRKDAERQKEYREKQKPELEQLREQIKDVQEKIRAAVEAAAKRKEAAQQRQKRQAATNQTASKGR